MRSGLGSAWPAGLRAQGAVVALVKAKSRVAS